MGYGWRIDGCVWLNKDFKIGDIIFWDIAAGHTGIVVESMNDNKTTHLVVHNIGRGPEYEDLLTYWPPIEAYRLQEVTIKKMQSACSYKHDFKSDPYFTNYYRKEWRKNNSLARHRFRLKISITMISKVEKSLKYLL